MGTFCVSTNKKKEVSKPESNALGCRMSRHALVSKYCIISGERVWFAEPGTKCMTFAGQRICPTQFSMLYQKCKRWSSLDNKPLSITILEAGDSKVNAPTDLVW